ncbi:MAG: MFS transporter [Pseudomonadota bacterium]
MTSKQTSITIEHPGLWAGVFICSLFFVTQITFSALSPVIPDIENSFSLSSETARLILSYGFAGYMVGQLVWGTVSDYVGRTWVVTINLALYAILGFLAAIAPSANILMFIYIGMGFLAATYTSVGNAILKDRYQGDDYVKMMANVGIVMAAGVPLGPGIAALLVKLSHGDWQIAFVLLAVCSLIALIGFISFARYPTNKTTRSTSKVATFDLFRNHRYFVALFSFGLPFGILISYLATGPYLLLKYYEISEHEFPYWYGLTTIVYLLGAIMFRRLSSLITPVSGLYWGTLIAFIGAMVLTLVTLSMPNIAWPGILTLALMLGGIGMIIPTGKAATMNQVHSAYGFGASMMKFTQSACAVGISAWAAFLFSPHDIMPFLFLYLGICVVAFLGATLLKIWA